jgi:hypothetical protein
MLHIHIDEHSTHTSVAHHTNLEYDSLAKGEQRSLDHDEACSAMCCFEQWQRECAVHGQMIYVFLYYALYAT